MDVEALLPLIAGVLPTSGSILAEDPAVAAAVSEALPSATIHGAGDPLAEGVDAVMLVSGEIGEAGERAPVLIDAAVDACRPGGIVVVAVASSIWARLAGEGQQDAAPGLTAAQLSHMLTERGMELRLLAAPGAAARLAGRPWAGVADLALDSTPGLLDGGPVLLAAGRTPRTEADRSRVFFSSIARRIVAAAVLCRDDRDRILLVFDIFKNAWTLPGGLVDSGESPLEAAVREAREEGGVDVVAGELLGVFAHAMPERVHLIYAARPRQPVPHPVPLHGHEISEVRWVSLDEAHDLLDAHMRRKLGECLDHPGGTWRW